MNAPTTIKRAARTNVSFNDRLTIHKDLTTLLLDQGGGIYKYAPSWGDERLADKHNVTVAVVRNLRLASFGPLITARSGRHKPKKVNPNAALEARIAALEGIVLRTHDTRLNTLESRLEALLVYT